MWLNVFRPTISYIIRWDVPVCVKIEEIVEPPPVVEGVAFFETNLYCTKIPQTAGIIEYVCNGFDRYVVEHDGLGKIITKLVEQNSNACGYTPIVISSSGFFTGTVCVQTDPNVPADGTVLGTKCIGFDLYSVIANGDGTTREVLVEINSSSCNYQPPKPNVWLENEQVEPNNNKVDVVTDILVGSIEVSIGYNITYRKNGGTISALGSFSNRILTPSNRRITIDMQTLLRNNRGSGTYTLINTGQLGSNFFDLEKNDAQVFIITSYTVIPLKRVQNPD